MAGDLEKAKREMRWAKSAADDRRWDQLEPKIQAIEAALEGRPRRRRGAGPRRAEALEGEAHRRRPRGEGGPHRAGDPTGPQRRRRRPEPRVQGEPAASQDHRPAGLGGGPRGPFPADPRGAPGGDRRASGEVGRRAAPAASSSEARRPRTRRGARGRGDVARSLRMVAEEFPASPSGPSRTWRGPSRSSSPRSRTEPVPREVQRLRAQTAEFQAKVEAAKRVEKAVALEREIKRSLSAAADELDRGYTESPQLLKAMPGWTPRRRARSFRPSGREASGRDRAASGEVDRPAAASSAPEARGDARPGRGRRARGGDPRSGRRQRAGAADRERHRPDDAVRSR